MDVKDLEMLRTYIDKKVEEISTIQEGAETASFAGFPFSTELVNTYTVSDNATTISLTGAAHYLIYYRVYDQAVFELHEVEQGGQEGESVDDIDFALMTEEIDLFYRPYDSDPLDPQAATKVFGIGTFVTPDENNPGSITVAPPSAGEMGVCLVFKLVVSETYEEDLDPQSFT